MNIPNIPNNSLTHEITELVGICEELHEEYTFMFCEPASEEALAAWENENGIKLPESYKDWLRFSNGAVIRDSLARFYSLNALEVKNELFDDLVVIGELIGDGERLCFSKSTGKIVRNNHGEEREYEDFKSFLTRMVIRMLKR